MKIDLYRHILPLAAILSTLLAVVLIVRVIDDRPAGRAARAARIAPPPVILPASNPAALRPLTAEQAAAFNAAIKVTTLPNPPARPFVGGKPETPDYSKSLDCLTAAIYYEAAIEADDGQRAVAQVVLNRLRHPIFPHTVCGVVFEGHERRTGCQFSFTCDGALARRPSVAGWARARRFAEAALAGAVYQPVGWATHYHTYWVAPYWSTSLVKVGQVGAHIFYRWQGVWGMPRAFVARYGGLESVVGLPFDQRTGTIDLLADAGAGLVAAPVAVAERPVLSHDQKPVAAPAVPVATGERPVLRSTDPIAAPVP